MALLDLDALSIVVGVACGIAAVYLPWALKRLGSGHAFVVHRSGGVVISGCSSGIGRHAALSLARRGFVVYAGVRKAADKAALDEEGVETLVPTILDVADAGSVAAAAAEVTADLARRELPLVGVVNNAGTTRSLPVELLDVDEDMRFVYEVNVFGAQRLTAALAPLLRASRGRVVGVSSLAGRIPNLTAGLYSSSKAALEALFEALRLELDAWDVSVSVVCPGYVKTGFHARLTSNAEAAEARLSVEQAATYAHLLEPAAMKRQGVFEKGLGPEVTTAAIEHALLAARPKPRYVVAKVGPTPAKLFDALYWYLPRRAMDKMRIGMAKKAARALGVGWPEPAAVVAGEGGEGVKLLASV